MESRLETIFLNYIRSLNAEDELPQSPDTFLAQFPDLDVHTLAKFENVLELLSIVRNQSPVELRKQAIWHRVQAYISGKETAVALALSPGVEEFLWQVLGPVPEVSSLEESASSYAAGIDELESASVRDPQLPMLAKDWLRRVVECDKLEERLAYLSQPAPIDSDIPKLRRSLAYALASDTLTCNEFTSFAKAAGYHYWERDSDRFDVALVSRELWSLPHEALEVLPFEWHQHILRNAPDYQPVDDDAEAITALEYITQGKVAIASATCLGTVGSVLFTGSRTATIVEDSRETPGSNNSAFAQMLAYYLFLRTNEQACFSMYRPDVWSEDVRERLAPYIDCLLEPQGSAHLLDVENELLEAFLRLGTPKYWTRLLFKLRDDYCLSIVGLLRGLKIDPSINANMTPVFIVEKSNEKWACRLEADEGWACTIEKT